MEKLKCILLLFWLTSLCSAQNIQDKTMLYENFIAEFQSNMQMEFIDPEFLEIWEYYFRNPLSLNQCDSMELSDLFLLNPRQIHIFLRYRYGVKNIISHQELAYLPEWDRTTAERLSLFTFIESYDRPPSYSRHVESEFTLRTRLKIPTQNDSATLPHSLFLRYSAIWSQRFHVHLLMEHDAGEPFYFQKKTYGFDFYSGSISYNPPRSKNIRTIILGDYKIRSGEGLVIWSGFMPLGNYINAAKKNAVMELKPHTSPMETGFFRGIAALISPKKNWEILAFASSKKTDGSAGSDSLDSFTNLYISGLHRSESEILRKQSIRESSGGLMATKAFRSFKIGILTQLSHWNKAWKPGQALYEQHKFSGNLLGHVSTFYTCVTKRGIISGELAFSSSLGWAWVNNWQADLGMGWKLGTNQRYFHRKYFAPFGEIQRSTQNGNGEFGFTLFAEAEPAKDMKIYGNFDFMKSDYLSYSLPESYHKWSTFLHYSWIAGKSFQLHFKSQYAHQPYSRQEEKTKIALYQNRWVQQMQLQFTPIKTAFIRSSIQYSGSDRNQNLQHGLMLSQMFQWTPSKIPIQLHFKYSYFSIPDFNLKVYEYDKSLLGVFDNPPLYGLGHRLSFYLRYKWHQRFSVETKATYQPGKEVDWDIQFQCSYSFYKELGSKKKGRRK